MIRKQIYLTEKQDSILKQIAEDKGIAVAEVLRRILDDYLYKQEVK